tara:strand:+ start:630 stop:1460 length:831 start_codon:yes stop_codon:yes gene_type:complete
MAIPPPLDKITTLPALGVDKIQQQFNKLIDEILDKTKTVITDSIKLPAGTKCDDPSIQKMKADLNDVKDGIQKIQESIPKIQPVITGVKTIITTAQSIRAAITIAQLSNPLTAAGFIAATANALQEELIVNAIAAIEPLTAVPTQTLSKLETLIPPLTTAIAKLADAGCVDSELTIPTLNDSDSNNFPDGFDYNDLLPSEFYEEVNVSESDIDQRSDVIQQLVEQQQNLLASILEAPSQVYRQQGSPPAELGKIGDYYVDTENNIAYGPKQSNTNW